MIKIFSGSSNPELSLKVAKLIQTPLAEAEITRFGNSEIKITVRENIKDKVCVVIQPTSNPTDTHLMELFFFADALKRNEAKKIIGVIPYFGYARQNMQHRPGESVSVNVVIRFLETVGFNEIYTVDLHDEATEGVFTVQFKNLSAFEFLAHHLKKNQEETVVVSPDQGGVERARKFAQAFYNQRKKDIAVVEKKRNLDRIHQSQALDLYGNVKGKTAILVDDIITSGNTLINAGQLCLKRGAKDVFAVITHHDFAVDATKKLQNSIISKIYTTDSIKLKPEEKFNKLDEISIAPLIAEELKKYR